MRPVCAAIPFREQVAVQTALVISHVIRLRAADLLYPNCCPGIFPVCYVFSLFGRRRTITARHPRSPDIWRSTKGRIVKKLQRICTAAVSLDYLWAWSATCCIDKDNSAALQEEIGAMAGWYRRYALTIVYLLTFMSPGNLLQANCSEAAALHAKLSALQKLPTSYFPLNWR